MIVFLNLLVFQMESDRVEFCHKFNLQFIWMAYRKKYQNLLFVIGSHFVGALCYADDWRAGASQPSHLFKRNFLYSVFILYLSYVVHRVSDLHLIPR